MTADDDFLAPSGAVATDALQGQQALADRVQALEDEKADLTRRLLATTLAYADLVTVVGAHVDALRNQGNSYFAIELQNVLGTHLIAHKEQA